jgi:hypothetical protein
VDGTTHRLAGEGVTSAGMRWSNDGSRLAYFARGVPMIGSADGTGADAVEVELPPEPAGYYTRDAEWSPDDKQVALLTRGIGALLDARSGEAQVISRNVPPYGTPWPVAFSADGAVIALLEEDPDLERTVLFVRTDTLAARSSALVRHYSLFGWSIDRSFVVLADTAFRLWLIPAESGDGIPLGGPGNLSPDAAEVAYADVENDLVRIVHLATMEDRTIAPQRGFSDSPRWSTDGTLLAYRFDDVAHRLDASADGAAVATIRGIFRFGPDGWVAAANGPELATSRPGRDTSDGATFTARPEANLGAEVSWLPSGDLAFIDDGALHIAAPGGSRDEIACPRSTQILPRQGNRI